jgi:ABC-2 type transport system ATP-binding protein
MYWISSTWWVEEIQYILTDVAFIDRGRIVLDCSMEDFEARYAEVMVGPENRAAALALKPLQERQVFGRSIFLFDHADRGQLAALGEVRTPSLGDLFVAMMGEDAPADGRKTGAPA